MTDLELPASSSRSLDRRTLIKGAAWSLPVIAVAAATPMAAASPGNASLSWTASNSGLLALRVLGTGAIITAQALVTVPTQFTLTNGPGPINVAAATVTVVVGRPSGISLSTGTVRGFGVYSLNNVVSGPTQNTTDYETFLGSPIGFPITTFTGTLPVTVASNGALAVPIEFGLSGTSTSILDISLLATFPVTLTVNLGGGNVYSASSTISVLADAGIL